MPWTNNAIEQAIGRMKLVRKKQLNLNQPRRILDSITGEESSMKPRMLIVWGVPGLTSLAVAVLAGRMDPDGRRRLLAPFRLSAVFVGFILVLE